MIAVDTNLLVHAHRAESPDHVRAAAAIGVLVESRRDWAIPWSCAHEFLVVVTQRVFSPPSTANQAMAALEAWASGGSLRLIGEGAGHLKNLHALLRSSKVVATRIYDARIVAICQAHGVSELWTADRDFSRFPQLKTRNPLIE